MGQEQIEAQQYSPCQFDLLDRQMRIYKWRDDSNFNTYVARAHFQNAIAAYQEQRFNQFLKMQQTKQYLQIYKFKDEMKYVPQTGNDQVIIFQKYHSSLSNFRDKLSFQEILYVFQGLLTGFQQINNVYSKIVVDSSCCFVTTDGAIRAWINPNVRSNKPWKGDHGQLIEMSVHSDIIFRILQVSQDSSRPSKRSHQFFTELLTCISNNNIIMSYSEIRRWINHYCYIHKIYMAKRININPRELNKCEKQNKSYFRQQRRTETSERIADKSNLGLMMSTQQSEAYIPNNNHLSMLIKSKSLQKRNSQMTQSLNFRTPNYILQPRSIHTVNATSNIRPSVSPVTHQRFVQQPNRYPIKVDAKVGRQSFLTNQMIYSRNISQIWSENCNKKSDLFKTKIQEVPSQSSSIQTQNLSKLNQQKISVMIVPQLVNLETKASEKTKENIHKKSMQISILKNMPSSQIQSCEKEQPRHKTFTHKRQTNSQSSQGNSANFSRAWITTKTITKLISESGDSGDQHSIKNSIAQSSDYYNDSVYSGVLTQMGRDVSKPHDSRTKTLGASRQ